MRAHCGDHVRAAVALRPFLLVLLLLALSLGSMLGIVGFFDARVPLLRSNGIAAVDAGAAVAPAGARVPCPRAFPKEAQCNVAKRIPVAFQDMPLARLDRWVGELPPGGCCAFSDAYRFIFVRTGKAASTTVFSAFLRPAICPLTGPGDAGLVAVNDNAGRQYRFGANCTSHLFTPLDSDCTPCGDLPRWKWLSYFVFSTARNPFSRAASSYLFCAKDATAVPFAEFCVNPDAAHGCTWLPGMEPAAEHVPNAHWGVQSSGFCGAASCNVDFVARVESISADMDAVVASINAMRLSGLPPLPPFSARAPKANNHAALAQPAAVSLFDLPENAHCVSAIASWYAEDFRLLGYSPAAPPPRRELRIPGADIIGSN